MARASTLTNDDAVDFEAEVDFGLIEKLTSVPSISEAKSSRATKKRASAGTDNNLEFNIGEGVSELDLDDVEDEDLSEFYSSKPLRWRRSWRSCTKHIALFIFACFSGYQLTSLLPYSLVTPSVELFDYRVTLYLPLLLMLPLLVLGHLWWKINDRYVELDKNILFLHSGCLSLRKKTVEMETETLLVVQFSQTPWERFLGVGTVSIGRFSRKSFELEMHGLERPQEIVRMLKERIVLARKVKSKTA